MAQPTVQPIAQPMAQETVESQLWGDRPPIPEAPVSPSPMPPAAPPAYAPEPQPAAPDQPLEVSPGPMSSPSQQQNQPLAPFAPVAPPSPPQNLALGSADLSAPPAPNPNRDLPGSPQLLVDSLREVLRETWPQVQQTLELEKVEQMAALLHRLGKTWEQSDLSTYAQRLQHHYDTLEWDRLAILLAEYPLLVDKIQQGLNS